MINTLYQIIRAFRPRQWLKNVSVFAAPFFMGVIFDPEIIIMTLRAFFVFCAVSSAGYIINDLVDAPKDRLHPVKKNRPIASGKLSPLTAKIIAIALIVGAFLYSFFVVGSFFTSVVVSYVFLQLLYSFHFRNVIILDALLVATLFILRVLGGALAAEVSISSWLVLTTIGLSLLLAFGKRRSEKTILEKYEINAKEAKTRKTLRHYPDSLLDSMISMSASFCIITYALFTFQVSPELVNDSISGFLPAILATPKTMMLTIPFVIYGVARYLYVIYEKKEGESPARVLLSDKPLLSTVILWGLSILVVIYLIPIL